MSYLHAWLRVLPFTPHYTLNGTLTSRTLQIIFISPFLTIQVLAALVAGVFGDKDIESDDLIDTDQGKSLVLDHQRGLRTGGACAGVFLFFLLVMAVRVRLHRLTFSLRTLHVAVSICDARTNARSRSSEPSSPHTRFLPGSYKSGRVQ